MSDKLGYVLHVFIYFLIFEIFLKLKKYITLEKNVAIL